MLTATVFDLVHGSFVDGWGIRSTVFLKGCPLRCKWCCNPESQSMKPELQFIEEHCTGCGKCVDICPQNALSMTDGKLNIDRTRCDVCGKCVDICWPGAFDIWGKVRTVDDIFNECMQDEIFYRSSGGGITLSGGEATLQPEFCLEMLRRCHERDIPVAIDTCGYVTTEKGLQVLAEADLLLFDVKGLDPQRHKENTGLSNEIILENLRKAEQRGQDVIIRYPVIPNHNRQEAEEIAKLLSTLSCVKRVDLIGYHQYGTGKYAQLGRTYPLTEDNMSAEEQQSLLELFQSYGLNAQLGG